LKVAGDSRNDYSFDMKVAKKSPENRSIAVPARITLTLPIETYRLIDELRGNEPRSVFLESLVQQERERRERDRWLAKGRAQYTPEVCRRTLELNAMFRFTKREARALFIETKGEEPNLVGVQDTSLDFVPTVVCCPLKRGETETIVRATISFAGQN